MHFAPRGEYPRTSSKILDLIMQNNSLVDRMINVHVTKKFSDYLRIYKMRLKNKVALAVELRIYLFILKMLRLSTCRIEVIRKATKCKK